jgi:gliding motility-associated-like protein
MVYYLFVTDGFGCVAQDSVFVKPYFPLWVPNTITPNNDGINDVFRAYGDNIEGFSMKIFDRWGVKIFESTNIEDVWLGGVSELYYVQNDTYVWVIEYDTLERREKLVGHVNVVR